MCYVYVFRGCTGPFERKFKNVSNLALKDIWHMTQPSGAHSWGKQDHTIGGQKQNLCSYRKFTVQLRDASPAPGLHQQENCSAMNVYTGD